MALNSVSGQRALLLGSFLAAATAFFAVCWSGSYLLLTAVPVSIGAAFIGTGVIDSILIFGVGYIGSRRRPFSSAIAILVIAALLFLIVRLLSSFFSFWPPAIFFAVSQMLAFGAVGGVYGGADAISPIIEKEWLAARFTWVTLSGAFVGALLGFSLTAVKSAQMVPPFFIAFGALVSAGVLAWGSSQTRWRVQKGRPFRISRPLRQAALQIIRRRYSLVVMGVLASFMGFALFAQLYLSFLRLVSIELNISFGRWALLFASLYASAAIISFIAFLAVRLLVPRLGIFVLIITYPFVLLVPLLYWAVFPSLISAGFVCMAITIGALDAVFLPSLRYALVGMPALYMRDTMMVFVRGGGALGTLFGALCWVLLRSSISYAGVVRTSVALDCVLLAITIGLAVSYRSNWLDRLQQNEWRFDDVSNRPFRLKLGDEQIVELLRQGDENAQVLGVICATNSTGAKGRFLEPISNLISMQNGSELKTKIRGYITTLSADELSRLLQDDEEIVRARTLGAAIYGHIPVTIDRLANLLRDESSWVRLMACVLGWQNGLEGLAVGAWEAMPLASISDDALIEVCEAMQQGMPMQSLALLKSLAYFPSVRVRSVALETLGEVLAKHSFFDAEIFEMGTKAVVDAQPSMRKAAVPLLVSSNAEEAILYLGALLQDPDPGVALTAAGGIAKFGEKGVELVRPMLSQSGNQLAARAACKALVLSGKPGEKPLNAYLYQERTRVLNHLPIYGLALQEGGLDWLPVRSALDAEYTDLLDIYSWVAELKGYLSAALALKSLTVHSLLWKEAVGASLARWTAPRQLLFPLIQIVRKRTQINSRPRHLSQEAQKQALLALIKSEREWLQAGALFTWMRLYSSSPPLDGYQLPTTLEPVWSGQDIRESKMYRVLFLKSVPLFSGFTMEDLLLIDENLIQESFAAGTTIFQEGSIGNRMFIIYKGDVELFKETALTKEREHIATLGEGTYFGEMGMLEEAPREATVVAKSDVIVLSLIKDPFRALMAQRTEMLFPLCIELTKRLRETNRKLVDELNK